MSKANPLQLPSGDFTRTTVNHKVHCTVKLVHHSMKVAIVGGGFSGIAVAINLLQSADQDVSIVVIEKGNSVGEGAAYGTCMREHILNVPAGKMSCISDEPGHLLKWLEMNGAKVALEDPCQRRVNSFIPRQVYSEYLKDTLQQTERWSSARLELVKSEAVEASMTGLNHIEIKLASGDVLPVDRLVLCLGHEPSVWPFPVENAPLARLIGAPWKQDYAKVEVNSSVLIVGSGLTMADAVISLHKNGHQGRLTAISRRGIIPKAHDTSLQPVQYHFADRKRTLMELYIEVLEGISRHTSLGKDWREAVDGLRPWTVQLWRSLSTDDKRLFIAEGKCAWDFYRHRVAPEVHSVLTSYFIHGTADLLRGQVTALGTDQNGKVLAFLDLAGQEPKQQSFDYIINCTGPVMSATNSRNPFMQSLLRAGLVIPGCSGLGIQVTKDGQAVGKQGPTNGTFVCGPQLVDRDFEAIAVPELRLHAKIVAQNVLKVSF